jgi:xanthine dehydrogenase accessory factor
MASDNINNRIVVRGAGEMASAVIKKFFNSGFEVIVLEKDRPTCVRREVCFAEACYSGKKSIEDVIAEAVNSIDKAFDVLNQKKIPIIIDPEAELLKKLNPKIIIDARMLKKKIADIYDAPIVIGLGPGFEAGFDCHAVIETNRGNDLGKVIYKGTTSSYTGIPTAVNDISHDRVLRAGISGIFESNENIGNMVMAGQLIGRISNYTVISGIEGVIRGLLKSGSNVIKDQKLGDIDPRGDVRKCFQISRKAQKITDGVLQAVRKLDKLITV